MIIKASQRSGGMQLGIHLLKAENEHVEVHEVAGFASDTVLGAMKETQALAKGTRCSQYLFSVSLNPPDTEIVPVDVFEKALGRVEKATGLEGQPRIVVFHEKEGRRHCHAVWSRIDVETMKAIPLPFFKTKLREVSKGLYLEQGWRMPRGFMDSKQHDPRNFTLAEWQQAKRIGRDPRELKALVQECWAVSDSRGAFEQALEERGLYLARGDRRGFVVVTYESEVLSVARVTGKTAKEVRARLGNPDPQQGEGLAARSVAKTRDHIASVVAPRISHLIREAKNASRQQLKPLTERRAVMTDLHRAERLRLTEKQAARSAEEAQTRASRFRTRIAGLWDRVTGRRAITEQENDRDAFACYRRDRAQRDGLVANQLRERRSLQRDIQSVRQSHALQILSLYRDLAR